MRKLIAALAVAALAAGAVATSADGQTATKFSVQTHKIRGHRVTGGFAIHGLLVVPGHRKEVVGSFKATFKGPRGRHVRAVFFFPDGKIKVSGTQDHSKVPIVGGTRRWNGASGKLKIHRAILTFTVVQG